MAYSTSYPPSLIYRATAAGTGGGALWIYKSADAESAYDDSGYITNAKELGMVTGDAVLVIDSTTPALSLGMVTVNASTGVGTLTAPVAIS